MIISVVFSSPNEVIHYHYYTDDTNPNIENFKHIYAEAIIESLDKDMIHDDMKYPTPYSSLGYLYDYINHNKLNKILEQYGFKIIKPDKIYNINLWAEITKDCRLVSWNKLSDIEKEIDNELRKNKDKLCNI